MRQYRENGRTTGTILDGVGTGDILCDPAGDRTPTSPPIPALDNSTQMA
jgi:hypothetical protein